MQRVTGKSDLTTPGRRTFGSAGRRAGLPAMLAALAVSGLALAVAPTAAALPADDSLDSQVASAGDDLADLDAKAGQARENLSAAEAALPGAQAESAAAQASLAQAQEARDVAAAALAAAEAKVSQTKARIEALRVQIDDLKAALADFARQVYSTGGDVGELGILLDSEDPGDLTERLQSITSVSRGKNHAVTKFVDAKAELDTALVSLQELERQAQAKRDEAAATVSAAEDAAARASEAERRVADLVAARQSAVSAVEARRGVVQQRFDQLKATQEALAAKLAAQEAARQRQLAAAELAASGQSTASDAGDSAAAAESDQASAEAEQVPADSEEQGASEEQSVDAAPAGDGSWVFPTAGSVVGNVGPRINPYNGSSGCHTGADIAAGMGTPIVAARAGTVVSVQGDDGNAYGNNVVIDHGDGLSSMSAHMSSMAVSGGETVAAGQVIGYVGSTGWSTGPHLHFEIHVGGVPYDPMGWVGGGSRVPAC